MQTENLEREKVVNSVPREPVISPQESAGQFNKLDKKYLGFVLLSRFTSTY
jgi:hypothetical protein